jgi:hypothetical protein
MAVPPSVIPPAPSHSLLEGRLTVAVKPWADVTVDGSPVGQTPLALPLSAGPHSVLLVHPDYRPYPRRILVRAGETTRLAVDLTRVGVPARR